MADSFKTSTPNAYYRKPRPPGAFPLFHEIAEERLRRRRWKVSENIEDPDRLFPGPIGTKDLFKFPSPRASYMLTTDVELNYPLEVTTFTRVKGCDVKKSEDNQDDFTMLVHGEPVSVKITDSAKNTWAGAFKKSEAPE